MSSCHIDSAGLISDTVLCHPLIGDDSFSIKIFVALPCWLLRHHLHDTRPWDHRISRPGERCWCLATRPSSQSWSCLREKRWLPGPSNSHNTKLFDHFILEDIWPYLPVVCADSWLGWDSWHHQHLPRTMSQEEDQLASLPWSAGVEAGLVAMVCDHSCALHPRLWSGSAAKILEITFVSRRERLNDLCCVNLYL